MPVSISLSQERSNMADEKNDPLRDLLDGIADNLKTNDVDGEKALKELIVTLTVLGTGLYGRRVIRQALIANGFDARKATLMARAVVFGAYLIGANFRTGQIHADKVNNKDI